ncbi:hypothetical protein LTR64_004776 [Lithohypha guttulata]|uniref:uncharacterized protein n=1 Tax=Lithohypha guttulata TaxID=1690604 RepID=UPI002DDF043B|nr:hypothetical protein LTR51_005927 [Lithohypha guttulata]
MASSKQDQVARNVANHTLFKNMSGRTAFFYGTLMAPPVLYRVIYGTTNPEPWQKALITVRPALLKNYRRHKVKYADYPAIMPHSATSAVRGSLVTGLLDEDIRRLDIFEGDQYTREKVGVLLLKDTALDQAIDEERLDEFVEGEVEAETYVWSDSPEALEGEEWDFEEFRREKMWAWVGESRAGGGTEVNVEVDQGFADVDRDVADRKQEEQGRRDPTGGRGVNGRITRELETAQEKKTKDMEEAAV